MTSVRVAREYFGMPPSYKYEWLKSSMDTRRGVPELRHSIFPFSGWGSIDPRDPEGLPLEREYKKAFMHQPETYDEAVEDLANARFIAAYSRGTHFDIKHAKWREAAEKAEPERKKLAKRKRIALKAVEGEMETIPKTRESSGKAARFIDTPEANVFNESYKGETRVPHKIGKLRVKLPRKYPSQYTVEAGVDTIKGKQRMEESEVDIDKLKRAIEIFYILATKKRTEAMTTTNSRELFQARDIIVNLIKKIPGLEDITKYPFANTFSLNQYYWRATARFLKNGTSSDSQYLAEYFKKHDKAARLRLALS